MKRMSCFVLVSFVDVALVYVLSVPLLQYGIVGNDLDSHLPAPPGGIIAAKGLSLQEARPSSGLELAVGMG